MVLVQTMVMVMVHHITRMKRRVMMVVMVVMVTLML
jgi:hypothetical protein